MTDKRFATAAMVLISVQQQAEDALRDQQLLVLQNLLCGNEEEILGYNYYYGYLPFLHTFLNRDPPPDLCARIVDMIVHHTGVEPFMKGDLHCRLPIHFAACNCHTMTPSVFATLLALTSSEGLRQVNRFCNTPLQDLQECNQSPHKAVLVQLYEQALADHAAFEARYHPLVIAAHLKAASRRRRYCVLACLSSLRTKLYSGEEYAARAVKKPRRAEDDDDDEDGEGDGGGGEVGGQGEGERLQGVLAFDSITSADVWRYIMEFV
jgi:hypothetical protein